MEGVFCCSVQLTNHPEAIGKIISDGGESGIRTHDTVSRIHTFQACANFLTQQNQYLFNGETLIIELNCDQNETRFLYFFKYKVIF